MTHLARISSEVVRVRGHFLMKLCDRQWALAKHAIAAGEALDDQTIVMHLEAALVDLDCIAENGREMGFPKLAEDAGAIRRLVTLFLERCIVSPNKDKLLTDVILEIHAFVTTCKQLSEQPTVLEAIDLHGVPNPETLGV